MKFYLTLGNGQGKNKCISWESQSYINIMVSMSEFFSNLKVLECFFSVVKNHTFSQFKTNDELSGWCRVTAGNNLIPSHLTCLYEYTNIFFQSLNRGFDHTQSINQDADYSTEDSSSRQRV